MCIWAGRGKAAKGERECDVDRGDGAARLIYGGDIKRKGEKRGAWGKYLVRISYDCDKT